MDTGEIILSIIMCILTAYLMAIATYSVIDERMSRKPKLYSVKKDGYVYILKKRLIGYRVLTIRKGEEVIYDCYEKYEVHKEE